MRRFRVMDFDVLEDLFQPGRIKEHWDEYRLAKSYANSWERLLMLLIYTERQNYDENLDTDSWKQKFGAIEPPLDMPPTGSPYWMTTVDPPRWFINLHLD